MHKWQIAHIYMQTTKRYCTLCETYRRPKQVTDAVPNDVAIGIILDILIIIVVVLSTATSTTISLPLVWAVAIDVKSQQSPGLGIRIIVGLSAIDELLRVLVAIGTTHEESIADGTKTAGGVGVGLVDKVVGLVLEVAPVGRFER